MAANKFCIPSKVTIPDGAYGVWQIPDCGVCIPLYAATSATAQKIVDKELSATIRKWGVGRIIEDHLNSKQMKGNSKWNVSEFLPDTLAFLTTKTGTYQYNSKLCCRAVRQNTCYMYDGTPQWPRYSSDIFCVSCTDETAKDVYLACFKYKGKMP